MTDEREPGRTTFRRNRVVILGKSPPNHILINGGTEGQIDLFGDMRTSSGRIALFHLDNRTDQIGCWPLRTGFRFLSGRKQQPILALHHGAMKIEKCRRLEIDRHATKPTRFNPKRTESSDYPVQDTEIWGTPTGTIEDQ
jgi:hypothetical protein